MDVTIHQALALIEERPGSKIVALVTWTRPPMLRSHRITRVANPHKLGVEKVTERYGLIGCSYESSVNRARLREGQPVDAEDVVQYFRACSLWKGAGEHVPESRFLVRHKPSGRLYLAFLPRGRGTERWRDVATGANLDPAGLVDYLPRPPKSTRQQTAKEIGWQTIGVANILEIRCGMTYRIAG